MFVLTDLSIYYRPALAVVAGLIAGLVVERLVLGTLRRAALRTKWEGDEILINGLHGMVVALFVLAGLYGALLAANPDPEQQWVYFQLTRNIIISAMILLATVAASRVGVGFVELYASGIPGIEPSTSIFSHITRAAIYVTGILVVLQTLGVSITPMLTALGVGGLGVALALQDTLSNLFAGLHLIASRQIRVGDYIQLDSGDAGYVKDITWRNTTIRSLPNNMIIVPNANLAAMTITNFNQPEQQMNVVIQVGVAYDSDLIQVERVTIEVAKEVVQDVTHGIADFEPFIRYHTFGESSIDFSVILRVKEFGDQYVVKHEFVKRLQERFGREGIEIPFPIRTIQFDQDSPGGPDGPASISSK